MTQLEGQLPTSELAPDVIAFTGIFDLTDPSIFLEYKDEGYEPDWCHVSAKHHALSKNGKRVHGWALWQFPSGIMGDFHSVWEDADGTLIDITPPKYGGNQILFVRDRISEIYQINGVFALPTNRMSLANSRFWWEGKPTQEEVWGLLETNSHLINYCSALGFDLNNLVTDPIHG
ncbi:MAG: hypothetical protein V7676_12475 [Parasphingorhabdus sp.]|uniref:hypothetical protein n=1 Tax=Parasphingorhabdus sp. TaxID=2709688 RepID=UPI003001A159